MLYEPSSFLSAMSCQGLTTVPEDANLSRNDSVSSSPSVSVAMDVDDDVDDECNWTAARRWKEGAALDETNSEGRTDVDVHAEALVATRSVEAANELNLILVGDLGEVVVGPRSEFEEIADDEVMGRRCRFRLPPPPATTTRR